MYHRKFTFGYTLVGFRSQPSQHSCLYVGEVILSKEKFYDGEKMF